MKLAILSPKDLVSSKGGDTTITNEIYRNEVFLKNFKFLYRIMLSEKQLALLPEGYFAVSKPPISLMKMLSKFILKYQHPIFTRFESKNIEKKLIELNPNVVFAEHLYMVPSGKFRSNNAGSKVIVASVHVLESEIQGGFRKILSHSLKKSEHKALSRVDMAVTFNSNEQNLITRYFPELKAFCIKPYLSQGFKTNVSGNFLFVGNQTWTPNRECVEEIHEIWRALNAQGSNYKIDIVGIPPKKPYSSIPDGVTHHGFVNNLDSFYENTSGIIAPIKTGGGVRVKLLEAISHGIPIITTSSGLDDLNEVADYVNLGKNRDDFVKIISKLGDNQSERLRQSNAIYLVAHVLHNKSMMQWQSLVDQIKISLNSKNV